MKYFTEYIQESIVNKDLTKADIYNDKFIIIYPHNDLYSYVMQGKVKDAHSLILGNITDSPLLSFEHCLNIVKEENKPVIVKYREYALGGGFLITSPKYALYFFNEEYNSKYVNAHIFIAENTPKLIKALHSCYSTWLNKGRILEEHLYNAGYFVDNDKIQQAIKLHT